MWNDHNRYRHTNINKPTIFPSAIHYKNLDNFLHDVRMAIRQEKQHRRLMSESTRYELYLERQFDNTFDVI